MALKTERSYVSAYRNFVRQSGVTHGDAIKAEHLKSYLDYMAMERAVSSSSQKVVLNALVFIVREVFELEISDIGDFVRAKNRKKIPAVMTKEETRDFFCKAGGREIADGQAVRYRVTPVAVYCVGTMYYHRSIKLR